MKNRELLAAGLAVVVGAPLLYLYVAAGKDGLVRADENAMRAMIGNERFEALEAFDECAHAERGELEGDRCSLGEDSFEMGFPHYAGTAFEAPDFTVRDREGNDWTLSEHRGKTLVLNFWSITCRPCIEEMPMLETLAHLVSERDDVEVVAISTDSGWAEVSPVLQDEPRVTHLFDPDKTVVSALYGTDLYPETWIVDPEGRVRLRYDGARDWSKALVLDVIDSM